ARDMAFPRLNAWSFWLTAFGGLLLYFSFIGGNGLYGAGSAPDVGWFAYAPLTARTFSIGQRFLQITEQEFQRGHSARLAQDLQVTVVADRSRKTFLG
ncbi:MAG: cbb3-type cytochrome c oxidase subunit I, partial [Candidatus Acidiferrum sp.]